MPKSNLNLRRIKPLSSTRARFNSFGSTFIVGFLTSVYVLSHCIALFCVNGSSELVLQWIFAVPFLPYSTRFKAGMMAQKDLVAIGSDYFDLKHVEEVPEFQCKLCPGLQQFYSHLLIVNSK